MIARPETHSLSADPRQILAELIDSHGFWRVLRAALAAARAQRLLASAAALDDHLRRDIGLPPAARPPDWLRHL